MNAAEAEARIRYERRDAWVNGLLIGWLTAIIVACTLVTVIP